jgi:hypothetical protein
MVVQTPSKPQTVADILFAKIGFKPTEAQAPILFCEKRFILVAGGEQAGKSKVAAMFLLSRIADTDDAGLYWLVAADYERTRAEFEYLVEAFSALGLLKTSSKRVDPGYIELHDGTRIETKSSKDPRTLAMRAPNGIIGCEASQLDLETYNRMQGRTAPRKAWLFLAGTFETSLGWYPQLFTAWQSPNLSDEASFSLPSYSNPHLYPLGRDDPEIKRLQSVSSDDFFMERIEGKPVPPRGLVFNEFRPDIHVREVDYIPGEPVYLWSDPGYASACAVEVIQVRNDQILVVDEVYEQGLITKEVIEVCRTKPWWKDVVGGAIDVAAKQHQSMPAPAEIWMEEAHLFMASQYVPINDGTERLKSFLKPNPLTKEPNILFDPKCRGIFSEFGSAPNPFTQQTQAYRWKTDKDGNVIGDTPDDRNNHGVKAIIYGLVDRYGYVNARSRSKITVKRWK